LLVGLGFGLLLILPHPCKNPAGILRANWHLPPSENIYILKQGCFLYGGKYLVGSGGMLAGTEVGAFKFTFAQAPTLNK